MDRLYLAGFYTLKFLIFILPSSLQNLLAKFLAFAFMKLKKKRFHVVMTNLNLAFGETKSKEEKLEIAKKCYYNFAKYLGINFILNQNTTKQKILEQVVFKNEHFLLDAIRSGRPIIVTTAHFGQWEIFGLAVASHFGPSSVLGRKLDSSVMDKILRANRAQFDVELIDKDGGAKDILKALKANSRNFSRSKYRAKRWHKGAVFWQRCASHASGKRASAKDKCPYHKCIYLPKR